MIIITLCESYHLMNSDWFILFCLHLRLFVLGDIPFAILLFAYMVDFAEWVVSFVCRMGF